jgi:hypothetical protein
MKIIALKLGPLNIGQLSVLTQTSSLIKKTHRKPDDSLNCPNTLISSAINFKELVSEI